MNCHQLDTILDDHALRSLSAAQRSEVDAHLANCVRCSNAWLGHQALVSDLPSDPRPDLFAAVAAHVVADRTRTTTRRFASWLGVAAAALVVAVVASVSLLRYGATPGPADAARNLAGEAANIDVAESQEAVQMVGQHYRVLRIPVPTASGANRIEVLEFFMFECFPCFSFEPMLEAWHERQPGYVELVHVPVVFNAIAQLHAQAFYTAEALGKLDELRPAFYDEIHVRGRPLATEGAIRAFFGRSGVDAKSFDEAFDSPQVRARLDRAVELSQRYGVSATPSIGVNGRYLTNGPMAGAEDLLDVVDTLVQSEVRNLGVAATARPVPRCEQCAEERF